MSQFSLDTLKYDFNGAKQTLKELQENKINGMDLGDYIFKKIITRVDPVEYIEQVLRAHLPDSRRFLHENQVALIHAVCNPRIRKVAAMMSRQCILEGTMVHTENGQIKPIEKCDNAWLTRDDATIYEVKVKGGHILYCTANHPIMTKEGWKKAGLLTKSDWVYCLASYDTFGDGIINDKLIMNDELAELIGWMTSDGYISNKKQSYKFTNINKHYLDRVEYIVTKYFPNIEIHKYPKGNGYDYLFIKKKDCKINEFREFIDSLEYDRVTKIPYALNKFTKSQVCAFFRGMYAGDGYIAKKMHRGRLQYECGLSCGNYLQFADFMRELLNKLGIRGQIKIDRYARPFYRVVFTGMRNEQNFKNTIGDIMDKPFPLSEYINPPHKVNYYYDEEKVFYYSPVISVKEMPGKHRVWDMEVPEKGWFIAGGIQLHNSGKCLAAHTLIKMHDNSEKYVEDLKVGDKLYPVDRKYAVVTGLPNPGFEAQCLNDIDTTVISLDENATILLDDFTYVYANDGKVVLPKTAKVILADGHIKRVGDLSIYDKLLTKSRGPSTVTSTISGEDQLYNIKSLDNEQLFTVNSEHLLSVIDENNCINTIMAKDAYGILHGWRLKDGILEKFNFVVEKDKINKYYGFTLDEQSNKLFLLGDYTVTHNTESISSFAGYLIDNYPQMRIGIFTPRIQQAEVSIGRAALFFQMNEERLNHKLVKCTKQKIELDNGSYVQAVSASDSANIEGLTFDVIVLDEAQKVSDYTVSERILPMGRNLLTAARLLKKSCKTLL